MRISRRDCIAASTLLLAGCGSPMRRELATQDMPPPAPREFRGAWVATVANIDWPSAPGLPAAELQAEIERIVDRAAALGLNALILQVRPSADALYASQLEPASEYVSGTQGLAPRDIDPLGLWIAAAHRRGIELHAWFNPFRARHPSARSPLAGHHVALRRPGWVRTYGDALWLDLGEPGAVEHTLAVIEDVVRRYAIDGVHLEDYFYPYPVKAADGSELAFPDEASYARSGSPARARRLAALQRRSLRRHADLAGARDHCRRTPGRPTRSSANWRTFARMSASPVATSTSACAR